MNISVCVCVPPHRPLTVAIVQYDTPMKLTPPPSHLKQIALDKLKIEDTNNTDTNSASYSGHFAFKNSSTYTRGLNCACVGTRFTGPEHADSVDDNILCLVYTRVTRLVCVFFVFAPVRRRAARRIQVMGQVGYGSGRL